MTAFFVRDRRGWLFRRLLSLTLVVAWWSLWRQVLVLIGSKGLLPAADYFRYLEYSSAFGFWHTPSLLRPLLLTEWAADPTAGDALLVWGCVLGVALGVVAFLGMATRLMLLLNVVLYLGYAIAGRSLLSFQWDNLLLECCLLAAVLPVSFAHRERETPTLQALTGDALRGDRNVPRMLGTEDEGDGARAATPATSAEPRADTGGAGQGIEEEDRISGVELELGERLDRIEEESGEAAPLRGAMASRVEAREQSSPGFEEISGVMDATPPRGQEEESPGSGGFGTTGSDRLTRVQRRPAPRSVNDSGVTTQPDPNADSGQGLAAPPLHSFSAWRREDTRWWKRWGRRFLQRAGWGSLLFRVLLFKLYFESGLAKYQSHLGDWLDGSAMSYYYETAPLPTPLAWYAHAMPQAWHQFESWFTLAFELLVPFLIFASRRLRYVAFGVFTLFQIVNIATANYGFFCYLSLALNVFLLDARDVDRLYWRVRARVSRSWVSRVLLYERWFRQRSASLWRTSWAWLRRGMGLLLASTVRAGIETPGDWVRRVHLGNKLQTAFLGTFALLYLGLSLHLGMLQFVSRDAGVPGFDWMARWFAPYRVLNTYHLFSHITRDRIEPEFQTKQGDEWTPHHMHYKVGPLDASPPYVAPHQPRVDFRLWFYGLAHEKRVPTFVSMLLRRMCDAPRAVQSLFKSQLPEAADAVRVAFWSYHFTTPSERSETGNVWKRESVGRPVGIRCNKARMTLE